MRKIISLTFLCVLLMGGAQIAFADQIILKNGDRVSGKIVKNENGKITIKTAFTGIITVSTDNIEKILEDEKEVKIINVKAENQPLTEEDKTENKTEAETKTEPVSVPSNPQSAGFTSGWDGAANIGFSFTSGNSKTSTFTAGVRAEKSGANDKWTTYLNSLWNRNRIAGVNVNTSNAIWGGLRYDRNITKKLFGFGAFDFERDKPQRLNFRSVVGGGLGYHAIKNDQTELDFFGGAAWNRTWFDGAPNTNSIEVLAGNSLKHKFNDRVKFQQGFTFYPNLTNRGQYRFVFDSTLSADVTKRIGWFVTIADRYNSAPLAFVEKNDFLFATGLKWSFGKTK